MTLIGELLLYLACSLFISIAFGWWLAQRGGLHHVFQMSYEEHERRRAGK